MEDHDLATDPAYAMILAECDQKLRESLDSDAVTEQAFSDREKDRINRGSGVLPERI